jgi:lipopolysaccharide export system permease protein
MNAIDRYMARLIAIPLLANAGIMTMLLILDRIRMLLDFVTTQGGPVSVVWKMLANLLPEYLGLGIPIGLLLGTLLTFRRLASSSELDVMRAVGISYPRMLRVPFLYAAALAALDLAIVGYIQPVARYTYEDLRYQLRTGALGASIKVGEFTHFSDRLTIRIEQSHDEGRALSGIFVYSNDGKGGALSIAATSGQFLATDNPDEIILRLSNGTLVRNEKGIPTPRVLRFTSNDLPIPLPKYEAFRGRGGRNLELTLPELIRYGDARSSSEEVRDTSWAALNFRLVEVSSMFLLPFLGLALGVPPKRSGSAVGVFLSIVMLVAFHKINEFGQASAGAGRINPILGLWGPFTIFAGLVIWMFYTIAFVPGGQPIGAIDRVLTKAWKWIRRRLPSAQRRLAQ